MTEWNAPGYARIDALQEAMAAEVLALLDLKGYERVLDLGCGNGKVTAEIAARVPEGTVVGIDSSAEMIAFASAHFAPTMRPNLRFETCRHSQSAVSRRVRSGGLLQRPPLDTRARRSPPLDTFCDEARWSAQLRLVPSGKRKSLENVIEETRLSRVGLVTSSEFHDPYLHLTPEQYAALAERNGLRVHHIHTQDKAWDFKSRTAFVAFGSVTFVEWTKVLPEGERPRLRH